MSSTYTSIVLRERPVADILPDTFETKTASKDDLVPGPEQVVVRVTYVSLDPAMRGWLKDARSYLPPVQIGEVMRAVGLGVVVRVGSGSQFKEGDLVSGTVGELRDRHDRIFRESPKHRCAKYIRVSAHSRASNSQGLHDVGKLKAGETLVVSGAAGAVGSLVCQLGKRAGARVIGIAGSPEKCSWVETELGADKVLNYKLPTFKQDFRDAVGYLDVYFDNVGGEILDLALTRLNRRARIVLCGAISAYNATAPGLRNYMTLIAQRAKIEGFIVFDYESEYPRAIKELAVGLADGSIKRKFHIVEGLENAPKALPMLYSGANDGKLVVKVSDELDSLSSTSKL
ncbi:hypothetical protein BKA83DRAFT_4258767 [Pisolithus microcarpus]|nr:hypothetical protein BKA83DRAFT_4258767 [Pisolithus microcarpus]